ncbi:hypothetical protein BC832DRAFT_155719 [Gaertneriomyces semiglobifer]|nr:hypothetical protein BC832DRAFT_155719 [Gaertneriomyces semiglobifer]
MPLASPTTSSTDPEPKFQDERYPILRPLPSTTSTRIPKGFITLNTEPSPVVSGFEDGPEQLMLKKIDENLTQYKEVSDIYAEIMEVVPAASVAFQDLEDDPFRCPTAPLDHSAATSQFDYAWRGLKDPVLTRPFLSLPDTAGEYRNQFDEYREQRGKSQIRMRTRDGTEQAPKRPLTAEAYIADRTKAMRRTLSSRYGTLLKHNYGGYIPPLKSKTVVPPVITFRNYLQFLDSLQTDFVFTLLYEEDAEMEARKRRQEELEERLKSEEEERQKEEAARLKEERRQAMTRYERGMWNKGVLDYMGEVMGKHEERVNKSGGGVHTVDSDDEKKSKADHDTGEQEAETTISLTELQTALEELWVQLKMPVDQKLDMAIKYGRHQYTPKVETSLRLWREVTTLILARESLLEEISAFEQTASDPTRFFLAGQPGSSEARMEEARAREQLLRKSHELSQQIMQLCDRIRKQLDEVVTYEGVPYTEKMRRDYTEIVRKAGREKLKEQSSVTVDSS